MDNHLMIFESADFGRVRSVLKDGAPWFVAVDVCKALGLNQVTRAMSRLDSDEGGLLEVPHPQNADKTIEINAVSEAGLYHLILCSKKPEARAFKRWITHEVIPSIRKHGAYMTDSLLDALEAHPEAVPEYLNRLRSENARNRELTRCLRIALPKAEYYDAFVDPADCTNIRTTAKELGVPEKAVYPVSGGKEVSVPGQEPQALSPCGQKERRSVSGEGLLHRARQAGTLYPHHPGGQAAFSGENG